MNVNVLKLIKFNMSFYSYFICESLYNEESDLIINYCNTIDKIESKHFIFLINEGWIEEVKDRKNIRIGDLKLTDKFKTDFLGIINTKNITFNVAFEMLREHYPSKVKDPSGVGDRRLQTEIERCKRLYKNVIGEKKIDEELHSLILQCINFEIKEKTKSRSLPYMQMLPTYLNKRGWEVYKEDVEKIIKTDGWVDKGSDNEENKTRLGSEDF